VTVPVPRVPGDDVLDDFESPASDEAFDDALARGWIEFVEADEAGNACYRFTEAGAARLAELSGGRG
jgi:hypothetical protein